MFLSLILDIGYYASPFVLVSGQKFIRYEHCFWALVIPCLCGDMAQFTMVAIAIDRLIAVAFPLCMVSCTTSDMGQSFIGKINVEEWNRKLIKALCFIIALNLIGVFVRVSVDLVFQAYAIVDVFIRTPYSIVSSFFTIIVYNADGPLLYIVR
ncbi:hypothetical protein niasHT_029324 [Heterodera trifolii]|uniref:Uncharacterized protein n=1 Tax=Heterodera trifolii TaxID=157864 RepID=A0ABD2KDG5_9BILA